MGGHCQNAFLRLQIQRHLSLVVRIGRGGVPGGGGRGWPSQCTIGNLMSTAVGSDW